LKSRILAIIYQIGLEAKATFVNRFKKSIVVLRKFFTFLFSLLFLLVAFTNAHSKPLVESLKEKKFLPSSSHQFENVTAAISGQHAYFEIHVKHSEQNVAARRIYRRSLEHDLSFCSFGTVNDLPFWLFSKIIDHPKHGINPSSVRQSSYYDFMFRLSLF
jgi:hypothetical protein